MKNLLSIFKRKQKVDILTPVAEMVAESLEPEAEIREPITSFLWALIATPRRFELERLIGPVPDGFPRVSFSQKFNETGCFSLLDKKTNVMYKAFVQEEGRVLFIYEGFPFDLNEQEGDALFNALTVFRKPARDRRYSIENSKWRRRQESMRDWEEWERKCMGREFRGD